MLMPTEQQMRAAIAARDESQDGRFYYGVMTTGVFCRPSCRSRAAKPENLCFFATIEAAMVAGYRPCKRCQPGEDSPRITRLVELARHIEAHADERLTLAELAELAGLSPSRLQRIFKQAFGVSPKAYQDAVRMRHFKHSLQRGEGVTEAIYGAGFGSISRVYGEATRNIGMTPKAYRAGGRGESISYACRASALGPMMMAATEKGVCFVQFGEDEPTLLAQLQAEFPNANLIPSQAQHSPDLDHWMDALDQHIGQGAPRPELPLDIRGTAFQMRVWQFLLSIKEGDVLSYGEVAKQIDQPKAVRAVASACGKNRIGVLIPCHRVLRGDGSLGGYRWGLARKRALLDSERERNRS
ncbi:bifunctional DNA-binding transcriptional regulator/O6-methylguanine-DNA methyltransferase Ada [Motiliproteus coralliicola]|uniref:methylated-DNA--[protein]-cysteine S-methyltransferase n=1 Tax=Motiliproteus coralliicola TaxID=2283196 RepID=A0A369WBH4_9GAMM|nr:bifunctional DNA-binding transcriptional regulator/O6-methylguanine-DNA methyltransferase Ada [Motiliproteus coralliicola]RDE19007.1 bifunctional DNA-binding transcriptional regulator/O6-methylguanine-DNA methyltransferase Ada [Motiliproteus coralliicola]